MPSTLLQVVNKAERELGFTASATVIDNTDEQAVQFLNLVNGLGNDLQKEYDWQQLQTEYGFSTVFFEYTGNTTSGSTTLSSLSSTTGLTTNPTYFHVTGAGIPRDTTLVSVNAGASTAVISREASATGTTVDLTFSQTSYANPSDFDRLIDRTEWDKSTTWEIGGPQTPQLWQWLKAGGLASGPGSLFRIYGNLFRIWPPPASEDYLRFEYISTFWVATSSGGTPTKASYTIDADASIFPDRLLETGLKLRYAQANGMAWLLDDSPWGLIKTFNRLLSELKAQDAGSPTLRMAPQRREILLGWRNIPDSSYGD